MKKLLILLILAGCTRIDYGVAQVFTVPRGEHESNFPVMMGPPKIDCSVRFDESAVYEFNNDNQSDWNKLIGLSQGFNPHENSARWVWAWNPQKKMVDIGTYTYVEGKRHMDYVFSLPLSETADLLIYNNGQSWVYQTKGYTQSFDFPAKSKLIWTGLYFGGQEVAPHDINVIYTIW